MDQIGRMLALARIDTKDVPLGSVRNVELELACELDDGHSHQVRHLRGIMSIWVRGDQTINFHWKDGPSPIETTVRLTIRVNTIREHTWFPAE